MTASDKVIVIVSPGYFELDSIVQISKTIKEVKGYFNPNIELSGFLFTMSDQTVNSKTSLQILRQTYTGTVFNTLFPGILTLGTLILRKKIFSLSTHIPHLRKLTKN
jgi:chromosome partitioning protein